MMIRLQPTENDHQKLTAYLEEVDQDFGIPLSTKVGIPDYAGKILKNGRVYVIEEQSDEPLSLICFYCNDFRSHTAFLPILSTKKEARGKGYAKLLIQRMIADCREEHMVRICCDSINPVAVSLYKSLGFVETARETTGTYTKVCLTHYPLQDCLLDFLIRIDSDFRPALSRKVILSDYVRKIQDKAELVMEWDGESLSGLVVLYCNDTVSLTAYIALVGVSSSYRGQGIARRMIQSSIQIVMAHGFKVLGLHSNNPIAVRLYRKLGFTEVSRESDRLYMELEIDQSN